MVEKKPVNVNWQMVFSVIPFLDLYASYRIQKLGLWLLIFWVAGSFVGLGYNYAIYGEALFDVETKNDLFLEPVDIAQYVLFMIVFAGTQVIVMRKLSKKWNNSFSDEHKIYR